MVGVYVGKGYDLAAFENCQAAVELGFASGGEPEVLGHHCRADDGGFLGFYEDDGFVRVLGQEVFFEEFDGVFRIDDDLSASLLDGWG